MKKLIKRIKFEYYWAKAEKAAKNNDKETYKKYSVILRKLIWE